MDSNPEGSKIFAENSQWFDLITFEDILRFMPSGEHLFIQWVYTRDMNYETYQIRLEMIKKDIANYYNIPYDQFQEKWNNYLYHDEKFAGQKMVMNAIIRM